MNEHGTVKMRLLTSRERNNFAFELYKSKVVRPIQYLIRDSCEEESEVETLDQIYIKEIIELNTRELTSKRVNEIVVELQKVSITSGNDWSELTI